MAVEWLDERVAYFPTPKVACTSTKLLFYYLNHGRSFTDDFPKLRKGEIHSNVWGTPYFHYATPYRYKEWERICIVRDPIERFLSAYQNRIQQFGELDSRLASPETLKLLYDMGIPECPTIEDFILNFHKYCAASETINHHFLPQSQFIGGDLSFYSHVFRIDRLDAMERHLSIKASKAVKLPVENRSRSENSVELPSRLRRYVADLYAGDYALLRSHLPDAIYKAPQRKMVLGSGFFHSPDSYCERIINGSTSIDNDLQIYVDRFLGSLRVSRVGALRVQAFQPSDGDRSAFVSFEFRTRNEINWNGIYTIEATIEADTDFKFGAIVRNVSTSGRRLDIGSTNKAGDAGIHHIDVEMDIGGMPHGFETESQWLILYFNFAGLPDAVCKNIAVSEIL